MGEHRSMTGQGGEIDWAAVFDGLSATGARRDDAHVAPTAATAATAATADETPRGGHVARVDPSPAHPDASVWDQLFPPPMPPSNPSRNAGDGIASAPLPGTTSRAEAGPSRPRAHQRATYPYSAPITPTGQYQTQEDLFAQLAQSMYAEDPAGGIHPAFAHGALPGPSHGRKTHAQEDLEERLRRAMNEERRERPPGSQHPAGHPLLSFPLPPPHPSGTSRGHARRLSDSTWSIYPLAPARGPEQTPPAQHNSSGESTPQFPPRPETPLQPLSAATPSSALDTEDKRQRNTLASAKFRAKRKKHMENISKRIEELEGEETALTRDVAELKQENKFLREMVELKYGLDVGEQRPSGSGQEPKGRDKRDDQSPPPQPPPLSADPFLRQRYR